MICDGSATVHVGTLVISTICSILVGECFSIIVEKTILAKSNALKRTFDITAIVLFMLAVVLSKRDDTAEFIYSIALGIHLAKPVIMHIYPTQSTSIIVDTSITCLVLMNVLYSVYNTQIDPRDTPVGEVVLLVLSSLVRAIAARVWD